MRVGLHLENVAASRSEKRRWQTALWREALPLTFGLIWLVIAFYPVFYMFINSLSTQEDFFSGANYLPPAHPTLANYLDVLSNDFGTYFTNSVFVTIVSVGVTVTISFLAAYAITRMQGRYTRLVLNLFLVGLAVPLQATIIPLYVLITNLHLYDTLYALILPNVAFSIPLTVLVLSTYLRDIPQELYQAMELDGAGHGKIVRALVFPLARPALMTVVIYNALHIWNGFLFALILTQSSEVRVLPMALWQYEGEYNTNVPAIMAAVFLSVLPIVLLYIFGRRYLLRGLIAGFSK
jgi:raffinose/stachyose/melibiose transport system permease protein